MSQLHAVQAPRISDATLARLRGFARMKPMTATSTMFDAGYERCKQELTELINREVGEEAAEELHPDPPIKPAGVVRRGRFWR